MASKIFLNSPQKIKENGSCCTSTVRFLSPQSNLHLPIRIHKFNDNDTFELSYLNYQINVDQMGTPYGWIVNDYGKSDDSTLGHYKKYINQYKVDNVKSNSIFGNVEVIKKNSSITLKESVDMTVESISLGKLLSNYTTKNVSKNLHVSNLCLRAMSYPESVQISGMDIHQFLPIISYTEDGNPNPICFLVCQSNEKYYNIFNYYYYYIARFAIGGYYTYYNFKTKTWEKYISTEKSDGIFCKSINDFSGRMLINICPDYRSLVKISDNYYYQNISIELLSYDGDMNTYVPHYIEDSSNKEVRQVIIPAEKFFLYGQNYLGASRRIVPFASQNSEHNNQIYFYEYAD